MSGESSVSSLKRFREASKDMSESENSVDFHSITGSVALNSTGSIASSAVGASSSLGVLRSNKLHDVGDGTDSHKIEISRSFLTPGNFLPPQADNSPVEAPSQRDRVATCLEAKVFQITMAILTVFALWGDDFLLWKMYKDFDDVFHALYAVTLVTFAAELTINSVVTEEYKWSFFFWLDVVATLSIALDIPWLMNLIMNMYGNVGQSFSVDGARAGRASRAGTKAGRIVRIVRLVRLIRVVNLSGWCVRTNKSDLDVHAEEAKVVSHQQEKQVKASRLGKMLSEQTTRTVILGVLCTLIVLPFIGEDNKVQNLTFGYALENIFWFGLSACTTVSEFIRASEQKLPINCTATAENAWMTSEGYSFMLYELAQSSRYDEDAVRTDFLYRPLLSLKVPDISTPAVGVNGTKVFGSTRWVPRIQTSRCTSAEKRAEIIYPFNIPEGFMPQVTCPANTCCWERHDACWDRTDECPWREKEMARVIFTPPGCEEESWDHSCNSFSIMAIYLDRYKTETEAGYSLLQTLFIVFLLVGGAMMFSKDTQILVINPIEKMVNIVKQLADDPLSKPDVTGEWSDDGNDRKKKKGQASGGGQLETSMLENTILKIGSLLQVGFGEAGAQIIGKNMSSQDGELNILSPGRKIVGIFGFCDIREFMETTECLLEEVMVFVNKIARIVHICVHQWSGAANKNIGDSFLVTWIVNDPDEQHLMLTMGYEHCQKNCELADKALIAFLKIIAELRRASDLSAYARHPKIIPKFGMDYHVNMGFGIHVGWAIEGAIGSEHKIDASYLSPHVNMCARLETATRQYGINLLFSQALHQIIAQRGRDKCRKLDVVMLKGSLQPMGIFTFDVNDEVPSTPEGHDVGQVIPPAEITSESVRAKGVDWIYVLDQDILRLQEGITLDFHNSWRQAFHFYINGKWTAAKELLEKCNAFLPYGDGPSECLLNYINEHDCIPPDDWAGCRALSSK